MFVVLWYCGFDFCFLVSFGLFNSVARWILFRIYGLLVLFG